MFASIKSGFLFQEALFNVIFQDFELLNGVLNRQGSNQKEPTCRS